jgi:hypothetical protein
MTATHIRRSRWLAVAWVGCTVALAQVGAVCDALPMLRLLSGRLGVGLVLLVLGTALYSVWDRRRRGSRPNAALLFAIPALVYAVLGLRWMGSVQATGDEPEYLLMAQSLWRDADLDLENNWRDRHFEEYTAGMPRPPFGTFRADGRPFPARSPGLPFLLAPVYALGGRAACLIFLAVLASIFGLQIRALALQVTGDESASFIAWLAAVGPPAAFMSLQIYPALLAGLAVALSLRLLLAQPGPLGAALAGLAAACLPWFHTRLIPIAVALGLIALWRLRGRALLGFVGTVGIVAAAYLAYHFFIFGGPSPLGPYGGRMPKGIRRATPFRALAGVFLDRSFGLLPYAPVFVLSLAPAARFARLDPKRALPLWLVALGVLAPVVMWRAWFGGFSPPARFLVPLVPVLATWLAVRMAERRTGLAHWTGWLLGAGYAWLLLLTAQPRDMLLLNVKHEAPYGFAWLSDAATAARYLPNFTSRDLADGRVCVVWIALALAALTLDVLARKRERIDRWFHSPALPLATLVLAGAAVDLWAR